MTKTWCPPDARLSSSAAATCEAALRFSPREGGQRAALFQVAQPQAAAQFGRLAQRLRQALDFSQALKGRLQPVTGVPAQPRRPQDEG